jgi:hypothetical protein
MPAGIRGIIAKTENTSYIGKDGYMKKQNGQHGFRCFSRDKARSAIMRLPNVFLIAAIIIALPLIWSNAAQGQGDPWPMDDWINRLKQKNHQLVATVQGQDKPIKTAADFKRLPDNPPPQFKLVNISTGKETPIAYKDTGKAEGWGKWIWTSVCDAAGLKPNCNGFFK